MSKLLIVCLGVILSWPAPQAFSLANQIGNTPRALFLFQTSAGKYTVRYDGFVEVYANERKRVFFLKMAGKGRLERVYFLEHEGDLLLCYDVMGQGSYLMRMEQKPSDRFGGRKQLWVTALNKIPDQAPTIDGDVVTVSGTIQISKINGKILRPD